MVISSRKSSSIIIYLYIIYLDIIIDDEHKKFVRRTNRSGTNGAARTETQTLRARHWREGEVRPGRGGSVKRLRALFKRIL